MSLLGFKKQFAGPVEARTKRQTIRSKINGHAVGRPIQLYTGLRTKACRKLSEVDPVCKEILEIIISQKIWHEVLINGESMTSAEVDLLAVADGFDDTASFYRFFQTESGVFSGFLIKWDWL